MSSGNRRNWEGGYCYDLYFKLDLLVLFKPYYKMCFSIETSGKSTLVVNLQIALSPYSHQGQAALGFLIGQLGNKVGNIF